MSETTVLRDFCARRDRERNKAMQKYGLEGLAPGGDPARDAFDYAINELVGMVRYAEMCEARLRGYADLPASFTDEAVAVCRAMSASASRHAFDLIAVRQKLQRRGVDLGKPEAA
jgi:hypothetical protein